ncbi:uncharacterized protein BX664DRAFT_341625 [Halteromyces radiatus]|uniref:uncharacterized protein n=1 Tax=Halteromyces radiatus TaxID=101107 RepID=UPI00222126BF|nr:uncharacterized protein BX664DRAFT_341625 [Halteromyces radiatus]KAI8079857.1 hypothetical protein BX664DRAFT_341625 [Halteromyces radiatus]
MTHHEETYNRLQSIDQATEEHKSEWTHELLAGAAGFEALHLLNKKKKAEGQEVDHALAKELLAGFAAASVDGFIESKGMNWIDKEKAKHHAKKEAEALYSKETGFEF